MIFNYLFTISDPYQMFGASSSRLATSGENKLIYDTRKTVDMRNNTITNQNSIFQLWE